MTMSHGAMAAMAFRSSYPRDHVGTLSSNYAINNLGHGLHVVDGFGQGLLVEPTATITGNTAFGNGAGDLADDTDCRFALWVANRWHRCPALHPLGRSPGTATGSSSRFWS